MNTFLRLSSVLVISFALVGTAHASTLSAPPNNLGLVGYWTMDGKTTNWSTNQELDSSGNGNTGTLVNMSQTTSPVLGKIGQALNFNGTNQYVDVSNQSHFALSTYTISAWVNANAVPPVGSWWTILSKGDNGPFHIQTQSNTSCGSGGEFGVGWNTGSWQDICSGIVPVVGRWYHVVVTSDGLNVVLYVNGVQKGTKALGTPNQNSYDVAIGTNLETGGRYWNGLIDDVRIYNRALSAADVARLYTAGAARQNVSQTTLIPNGLVGYWTMDGKNTSWSTNQELDSSGNGNTGTLVNMSPTTSPVLGKIGQAMAFNGVNQSMPVSSNASLNITNSLSISLWIKHNNPNTGNGSVAVFVSKGPYDGTNGDYLLRMDTNMHYMFALYQGGWNYTTSASTISPNVWHHIVATWDGTTLLMYQDGVQDADTQSAAITLTPNAYPVTIGQTSDQAGNTWYTGSIDDVRIYNRALSAQEVQELYAAGSGSKVGVTQLNKFAQGGLVGYWSFNGKDMNWATGQALDRSGNGNNGQLVNMSTTTSPVPGKIGQALSFTGSQWVQVPNASSLNVTGSQISFGGWIYPTTSSGYQGILGLVQAGNVRQYAIYLANNNPSAVYIALSGVSPPGAAGGIFNISTNWVVNKWNHVFFTYNSLSGTAAIYLNGVQVYSSNSWSGPITTVGNYPVYIGDNTTTDGFPFHGIIDDVRIYNRALSAAEVKALYNLGR